MISYPGYDDLIVKVHDHHQEHVFEYWNELSTDERRKLLDDLRDIDFDLIRKLSSFNTIVLDTDFSPAPCISLPRSEREKGEYLQAEALGKIHVRDGKVAAFMVAGGQGSRLGYEGPKGMFKIGPVSNKSLFQIHAEKILKYSQKYNAAIPFLIMTSRANHEESEKYLRDNNFFGLAPSDVYLFSQSMLPSLDPDGRLILEKKNGVFKNPDGHGGSLTALHSSGVLAKMKQRGIETISYFQVDNPLVKIIDTVFIGFHVMRGADVSNKAVKKAYPDEKVGVFVRFSNNTIGVVEYSDFPEDKLHSLDDEGNINYSSGNIAVHLFKKEFVDQIAAGTVASLPYHAAKKKIKALKGGAIREIEGYKFEKFVFDALPLTDKNIVFEVLREEEFAPVKNPSGVDSVESARKLMQDQYRRWLAVKGIRVSPKTKIIEISPLVAVEPDDINKNLVLRDEETVYLS